MDCANCGSPATPGQKFCGECGQPLASGCPSCGSENPPGQKFCGECGTPLADTAVPRTVPAVETPSAQRRVVSVLFVDLVGFTSFSEGRDPEDVRALITRYFDLAAEAVAAFGGTVDKFIGDAVMAWWGATTSQEDDAERATRAALDILDRVTTLGEEEGLDGLAARAGVMTGEASVGPGGNEKGLLLGDLVNSASRLQSLAAPDSVFVGARTADLVASALEVISEGSHRVKGKEAPLEAFRVGRVLGSTYRPGRDVIEPPFVGRDSELRILKDNLHAVDRDKRARLVSLVGHAGIGKSRLIWEFLKYIDGLVDTIYWHEGRSPSYGDGLAMWALGEMIRRRCRISETDTDEVSLIRLSETVAEFIGDPEERRWVEPRLASILGVGEAVAGERTELFAAGRALFEAISTQGTTVLVFEDVQWADTSLLEFIEELPDWSQNHPILVVSVTRPDLLDRRPDWGSGRRGFTSIYLSPLSTSEIHELVEGAVPGIPASAVERIADSAGGIPLFAVEMLRMLMGDGRLTLADGIFEITGDLTELEVPSSVHAVVAARIDRLPLEARDLTRDAAVLGFSFTLGGLAALREEEPDKVERQLSILVRNEILELVRDPRSPEAGQYQWVQAVLREVVYGRIGKADRHELHLRAARHYRDLDDPELAPVAAQHYVDALGADAAADETIEAELVNALGAALERSLDIHAHEQVVALAEAALPVAPARLQADLRERAAKAAVALLDVDTALRHADALIEAGEAGDVDLLHRGISLFGAIGNGLQRGQDVVTRLTPHLDAHPDFEEHPALAKAAAELARAQMISGLSTDAEAAELADRAIGAAEKLGVLEAVADAMITRGTAFATSRNHQAMALLRGAVELCRRHGFTGTMLRGLINIGYASQEVDETIAATEEAFAESKRVGDRNHAAFVASNLSGGYYYLWRWDDLEALLEDPAFGASEFSESGRLTSQASLARARGTVDEIAGLLEESSAIVAEATDPQIILNHERGVAADHFFEERYEESWEIGERHLRTHEFAPLVALSIMALAAAGARNREWLELTERETRERMSEQTWAYIADTCAIQLALMDGQHERALEIVDASTESMGRMGALDAVFTVLAVAARDLPEGPERDACIRRAKAQCEATGAPGFIDWLDRWLKS